MKTRMCIIDFNLHSTFASGHILPCSADSEQKTEAARACLVLYHKVRQSWNQNSGPTSTPIWNPPLGKYRNGEKVMLGLTELRSYFKTWGSSWFRKCPTYLVRIENRERKMGSCTRHDQSKLPIWESSGFLNIHFSFGDAKWRGRQPRHPRRCFEDSETNMSKWMILCIRHTCLWVVLAQISQVN